MFASTTNDVLSHKVYVKEEPLDTTDVSNNINDEKHQIELFEHVNVGKCEVHDHNSVVSFKEEPQHDSNTDIKIEDKLHISDYETCKEFCNGFCLNCQNVTCILDSNIERSAEDGAQTILLNNILQINLSHSYTAGTFTLKTIPEGIKFGPCCGLKLTRLMEGCAWKLQGGKFVNSEGIEDLSWMRVVNHARDPADQNLIIFQHKEHVYYKTKREIHIGEELLIYFGEEHADNCETDTESYFYPPIEYDNDNVYVCTYCCLGFGSGEDLGRHRTKCLYLQTSNFSLKEIVQCDFCQIYLDEKEYTKYHKNSCSQKYPSKGSSSTVPGITESFEGAFTSFPQKPFECDICNRCFTRQQHLNVHLRIHSGERPYRCETCNKSFTRQSHLTEHVQIHSGEKPFKCDICSKSFRLHRVLRAHLRTHTGEKPFECEICKKRFAQQSALKDHMRTHTGEKPYECEICKKRFPQKQYLTVHMRIHGGEKPFQCMICEKCFLHKASLKIHMNIHTKKMLEQTKHIRAHTGE